MSKPIFPSLWILLLAFYSGGCHKIDAARDWLQEGLVSFVPIEVDVNVGKQGLQDFLQSHQRIEDPLVDEVIQDLARPLLRQAKAKLNVPYSVIVTADSTVNAYALPGGPIILPAGFLLFAQSASEVQGVLAHEFAHITERHSMQRLLLLMRELQPSRAL